jgi:ribosome-associated heat shock protein Hsp15
MHNRAMPDDLRLDKWLWAARFFKTRSLAADACDIGRVEVNGQRAKASRVLRLGDRLRVHCESGVFHVDLLALSQTRGPAAIAQTLYRETDASREARLQAAAERKEQKAQGLLPEGKPNRRDRHELAKLRGRIHRF